MGEKISVDAVNFAQVVCQELRVERIVHNVSLSRWLEFHDYCSEPEKKTPLPVGES
jgi:hypothetical protein